MGRSGDHLLADCHLGQLSLYLNISILKAALIQNKLVKRKCLSEFQSTEKNIDLKRSIYVNE